MRSAAGVQEVRTPCRSMLTIASSANSTMAAHHSASSKGRLGFGVCPIARARSCIASTCRKSHEPQPQPYPPPRRLAKHEINRAHQAETGPEEVERNRLAHVAHRERDEHGEGDHLLDDFQLCE